MTASSEPRARRVRVPRLVGMHINEARIVLQRAGLAEFRVRYRETYEAEHSVVAQHPQGDQLVEPNQPIILDVSRQSLAQYLPQIFQQSAAPEDSFLRGFLYIVQHISDSVAQTIDEAAQLFDPRTTKEDFLPWLASWLAVTLSPDWDELQRRKMLLTATRLFPTRGTRKAIEEFVRIYTGADVSIEENTWPYCGFRIGVSSTVGLDTVILPPMNLAHCFVVRLDRPASDVPDEEIIKIHQIVAIQKPAHTSYFLAFEDEASSGEMGMFMQVGSGAIGVGSGPGIGAAGIGVSVPSDAQASSSASDSTEGVSSKSTQKGGASKARSARKAGAKPASRGKAKAEEPKKQVTSNESNETSKKGSGRNSRAKSTTKPKRPTRTPKTPKDVTTKASEADGEQSKAQVLAKQRRAKASAERQARKEAAEARAQARKARAAKRDEAKDDGGTGDAKGRRKTKKTSD